MASDGCEGGSALTRDAKLESVADALYFLFCLKKTSDKYIHCLRERA